MESTKLPRLHGADIEMTTPEMIEAWETGVSYYHPWTADYPMDDEGGVTQVSLENLAKLLNEMGRPDRADVGPNGSVLFRWASESSYLGESSYLATGFAVGYGGEGPCGLARFGFQCGFGTERGLQRQIALLDIDYQGPLWPRKPEGN